MNRACIIYSSRGDATPESEVSALANVYRFILDCHKKKASRPGGPDDAKGPNNDRAAEPKYTR